MSVLERIRALLNSAEETGEIGKEEILEIFDEIPEEEVEEAPLEEAEPAPPVWEMGDEIPIDPDSSIQLVTLRDVKKNIINILATESASWEIRKAGLLDKIKTTERALLEVVSKLREKHGIPEEEELVLGLPDLESEEPTAFMRKK